MTLLLGLQFRRVSSLVVFTWVGFERTIDLEIRNQTEYNGYFFFRTSKTNSTDDYWWIHTKLCKRSESDHLIILSIGFTLEWEAAKVDLPNPARLSMTSRDINCLILFQGRDLKS